MCNLCRENDTVAYQSGAILYFSGCPNQPQFHDLPQAERERLLEQQVKRNAAFRVRLEAAKANVFVG